MSILKSIGLTEEQKKLRNSVIGGSDANTILSGDAQKITNLWEVKCGFSEPEDLSDVLPVIMGQFTEELNAAWYEKKTGDLVTNRNERFLHSKIPYMAANLDGVCLSGKAIWEAKHVNAFSDFDEVLKTYLPQLHHNAFVFGVKKAVLSVFKGTTDWKSFEIDLDKKFLSFLLQKEKDFWDCVKNKKPPIEFERPPEMKLDDMIEVDFTGNNLWAAFACEYIQTAESAKRNSSAKDALKSMVDNNVKTARGHGVSIKRSKRGYLYFE